MASVDCMESLSAAVHDLRSKHHPLETQLPLLEPSQACRAPARVKPQRTPVSQPQRPNTYSDWRTSRLSRSI